MIGDYTEKYAEAKITPKRVAQVRARTNDIVDNKPRYQGVSNVVGVPWWCIGAIHSLESFLSFRRHLHNGDALLQRTTHVPRGRPLALPASGQFPYTWEESAIDALSATWRPGNWDLNGALEFLERYNGLGYRQRGVATPYLWSYTNQYTNGLFLSDGHFSEYDVSGVIGAVAIFKELQYRGIRLQYKPTEESP